MPPPHDYTASWRTKVEAGPPSGFGPDAPIEIFEADDLLGIGLGSDILIVDDDAGNLTAYEAALAPLGRALVPVQSGLAALARLLDQDFALVLLDVSMPGMTGLETARRIRERPRNKGLPIIFITGHTSSSEMVLEAYEAGAFDFIVKPILPEVLRAKARVYLQLQERTQALRRHAVQLRATEKLLDEAGEELRTRDAAAATAHRLLKLQEVTAALAHASTPHEVAAVTVRLGAEAIDASSACMWLARPGGSLVVEHSHGLPAEWLAPWREIAADSTLPVAQALRERCAIWAENADEFAREAPEIFARAQAANRAWAFATLPLVTAGQGVGAVVFSFQGSHRFTDEERRFLAAIARTCEQALDRARLYVAERVARRSAEEANLRKDEFLAMLSHELRNPLWATASALELVKDHQPGLSRELSIIERQVEHLTHIVGDLLDVARITRGKISLRREPVGLAGVVASALESVRPLIARHAHQVTVEVPADLVIDADRHRVQQVMENLIDNAAEYTAERGHITISAARDGAFVRVVVQDNGRGISPALLPHLFELFVQGEQPLDRSDGGLGVGLTLVHTLVELHGGTIEAHSDGPGTGARFTLRWPRSSETTSTAELRPLARPAPPGGRRVLIVDDNADAADMLGELLEALGHEVTVTRNGAAALDVARSFAPQVALLDIGLPVMDGYELARRLRLLESCRDTLLVAVTGYGQPDDQRRSKQAGFAHHLVKPVDLKLIVALLADAPGSGGADQPP